VTLWSEQAGHYVNLDGRLQTAEKAVNAPDGVRENTTVLTEIAMRMNMPIKQDWRTMLNARKSSVTLA
jgi:formate dehydrogenase major subunit